MTDTKSIDVLAIILQGIHDPRLKWDECADWLKLDYEMEANTIRTALHEQGYVIMHQGNACERYPYCNCSGGLTSLIACTDRAMTAKTPPPVKEAGH